MKTYTIKDSEGKTLSIADSSKTLIESLFNPNGTLDGCIEKRTKNNVFFTVLGRKYAVNKHGVIIKVLKQDNGKTFYQHAVLDFDYNSQREFSAAVKTL